MKILILILVGVIFKSSLCKNEPLGKYFYEDLKCTLNNDGKSYNCNVGDEKTCVFEGKTYKTGEKIQDDICPYRSCECTVEGKFNCVTSHCPEYQQIRPECRLVYTLKDCCPVWECSPSAINCTQDDIVYTEGSKFSVKHDQCKTCICKKGLNKEFEEPYCKKLKCLEQFRYRTSLKEKCAPVYIPADHCCPVDWECNKNQRIVKMSEQTNSALSCDFGKFKVPYGYGFERSIPLDYSQSMVGHVPNVNVRCECTLPPLMTCVAV